jgi:bacterioferritin-associated ferredoxin
MIVCQCNVLSKAAILGMMSDTNIFTPRSPAQVQKCLGCAPKCGRCVSAVREIIREAQIGACTVGCAICPSQACAHDVVANDDRKTRRQLTGAD